jgi:imidazolonepropionase
MFSRDQKTNGQKAPSNKRGMRTRESTDMLIVNAEELVTLAGASNTPLVGKQMHELQIIKDGAIAIRAGKIVAVGKTPEISKAYRAEYILSAKGKTVLPGFVDPHTHLIFAGTREEEFEERQQGASYMEILSSGGGVLKTAKETHKARVEKLVELGLERLDTMVAHGTTTVEVKSGYGLNTEDELKILAAAKQVNQLHELNMVTTFLGAHVPPLEYRSNIDAYVNQVVDEMIPQVAQQGYAEFCDVFCDRAAFNLEQAKRVLLAGKQNGLKLKIHADQMSTLGGAEIAADIGTVTADHLNCASPEGIQALSQKGVIAVLLPAATFSSMTNHYADARLIIDSGVPVALGTDFNANNWIMNMQCVVAMAC